MNFLPHLFGLSLKHHHRMHIYKLMIQIYFVLSSAQTSCMTTRLYAVLSVITKSIFSTKYFSVYFQPDKATHILIVITCKSFKLALVCVDVQYWKCPLLSINWRWLHNIIAYSTLGRSIIRVCYYCFHIRQKYFICYISKN